MNEDKKQVMRVAHALEEATGFRRFRELYERNSELSIRIMTMEANECHVKECGRRKQKGIATV